MRKKLLSNFLPLMFIAEVATAAQIKEALPDGEVEAMIAAQELSRVKVIGDRIKAVRSHDSEVEIVEDTDLGEIYLRPNLMKPINMFITTERNNTYKLLLIPKKMPAEQIFISGLETILDSKPEQRIVREDFKNQIINLMRAMTTSKNCSGFKKVAGNSTKEIDEVGLNEIENYISPQIKGQVFEIRGNNSFDISLVEELTITHKFFC